MNPNQVIALVVRLFAIFILLNAIRYFIGYYSSYGTDEFTIEHVILIIFCSFLLIISILLWKFPFTVSRFIYSDRHDSKIESWSKDEIYIAGFVIVGVYYLYNVLSDTVYWILYLIYLNRLDRNFDRIGAHEMSSMITTVFELVVAVVLIFGASGLKNILFRIRYAGIEKDAL